MARMPEVRAAASQAELARIPVGVQPEEDGLLICLECGRWLRALGIHVSLVHEISADEYRRRHELPRGRGLLAQDLRDAAAERAVGRVHRYPRARETRLRGTREETERAVAAQQESWQRAGTRQLKRAQWDRLAAENRQRTRAKFDGLARTAGYRDVDHLLEATSGMPGARLASLIGVSESGAKWLRRYHAAGFNLEHHPTPPNQLTDTELAAIPLGVQPITDDWVLCRQCGQWLKSLARHVTTRHQMNSTQYRQHHGLPADLGLVAGRAAKANVAGRAERLHRAARDAGYADLADLITATRQHQADEIARLLGVTPAAVYNLRRRLSPGGADRR